LLYSTVDGHTLEICERLRDHLGQQGHAVTLRALQPGTSIEKGEFERIVIGASIRYGRHRSEVSAFIAQHLELLRATPSAFFSVNVVARKPQKRDPDTNPYVRKFLRGIAWKPALVAIFAGKIDYPRYGFFDRQMIRLIMWMTNGPTDPASTTDFTDWAQVEEFAHAVAAMD
jgi:menaquinone-dependent protoporphyrinogen oxidase